MQKTVKEKFPTLFRTKPKKISDTDKYRKMEKLVKTRRKGKID